MLCANCYWSFSLSDLSKNRLCEVPEEVCQFVSLETLSVYHNCVRSLTPSLCQLQALTYLNLRYIHTHLTPFIVNSLLMRVILLLKIMCPHYVSLLPVSFQNATSVFIHPTKSQQKKQAMPTSFLI